MILKMYADESIDPNSSLMNLSGYLMTEDQFVTLDHAVISARGELPYFHVKENHAVEHPEIYKSLVALINPRSVLCGFSVSLKIHEYDAITDVRFRNQTTRYWMGNYYTYALGHIMAYVSEIVSLSEHRDDLIAFVFENGHPSQGEANMFWSQLSLKKYEELKRAYRYASHTFVDGKGPLGSVLQLCDILANNVTRSWVDGKETAEFKSLVQTQTFIEHHEAEDIFKTIRERFPIS